MGTRKISSFDTHLDLLDKKAVDGNIYRKIGFFIGSFLLFLVNSVSLFFRFIAGHLFRMKNSDASHRDDSSVLDSRELKPVKKFEKQGEAFMDEKVEKRMPTFSFKYQSQNFEEKIGQIEEDKLADEIGAKSISEKEDQPYFNAADVHNYRFLPKKNSGAFVEEQETMTFHVQESFVSFEEENFYRVDADMIFLSVEDFMKSPMESIFEEESNSEDYKILDSVYKQRKTEGFIDFENRIFEEEKSNFMSSETNLKEEREIRFISEDFSCFDFEFYTESWSDGYSVKELIYDSDMDGFLSEKDVGEQKLDSENREISVNSIYRLDQVHHESCFLERSGDDDDADDHDHDHDHLNDEEDIEEDTISDDLPSLIDEEINSYQTFAENESTGKPVTALKLNGNENIFMEIGKSSDASSTMAKSLQKEFIEDSSDEELSSLKNGSSRLDSFGEVHFFKDVLDSKHKTEVFDTEELGKIKDDKSNCLLTNSKKVSEETEQKSKESGITKKKSAESKYLNFDYEKLDEQWEKQYLIEQLQMKIK